MLRFWKRLFGRFPQPQPSEPLPERIIAVLAEMKALRRPCLRLAPGESGLSRLGGIPEMIGEWPRYRGRPLSLVAQLDLAEMSAAGGPDWLPTEGRLLFFYELEHGGWGFDPKDAGSALVLHETGQAARAQEPADLHADMRFEAHPVTFTADLSLPSDERLNIDWRSFSSLELSALEVAVDALAPAAPTHQVGGYPNAIQSDEMELECQLVTNGLYRGLPNSHTNSLADELRPGAIDWRLLLQLDTDPEAGMMWGDTGRLYFWIREQDARAGDFSKAWAILQCY